MEDILDRLETSGVEEVEGLLKKFIENFKDKYKFNDLITLRNRIWLVLYRCLCYEETHALYDVCLQCIRILSRDKMMLESDVVNTELINALLNLAKLKEDKHVINENLTVTVESLKCLCNMAYSSSKVRTICFENGATDAILRRLRTYPDEDISYFVKIFDMKLMFLITALVPESRSRLKNELHALTYLTEALDLIIKDKGFRHTKHGQGRSHTPLSDEELANLACEILKIMFNLTINDNESEKLEDDVESSFRLLTVLRELLVCSKCSSSHNLVCSNVINLLTNMPVASLELLMPQEDLEYNNEAILLIINFLSRKLAETPETKLYEGVSPALTFLIDACRHHKVIRCFVRRTILPPLKLKDVTHRPEEGTSLRGRLCKLLTSIHSQLRDLVGELLFVLCKENVDKMIKYTGFGNAAGMFAQYGLLAERKESTYSSDSEEDEETEEYKQYKSMINPVTGAYETPKPNPVESMSEEQKEYEAMQLVDMMDKLCRKGIIQPCKIGEDGKPHPVEHILELQESLPN